MAEQHTNEAERRRHRDQVLRRLRDEWSTLPLEQGRELLHELLARIEVRDDSLEVVLRT
jgi:hypothetical protein